VGGSVSFTARRAGAHRVAKRNGAAMFSSLEDLIGRPLFERRPTGLKLTPAGSILLPVVSKCLDRMEQTINTIRNKDLEAGQSGCISRPRCSTRTRCPCWPSPTRSIPETAHRRGDPCRTSPAHRADDVDMAIVFDRPNVDDAVADLPAWMVRVAPLRPARDGGRRT
jgi:LysR family glycine cleavage system transcriptional activator